MDRSGLTVGVLGGLGLGLLLGSEFSGMEVTISGGVLLIATIVSMLLLSGRKRE